MNDEARVIDALQTIQDYCMETEECGVCCLYTKNEECALTKRKSPEEWKLWVEVKL